MEGRVIQAQERLKELTSEPINWDQLRRIHLIGICGTGMGSLAGLLKEQGYDVMGSDQNVYPPMSGFLDALKIPVIQSYDPEQLPQGLELVVVGNACKKDHPQVLKAIERGIPLRSFPAVIGQRFMPGKQSVVIAGTHGKTTTTAMVTWLLQSAGLDPSWLVGGIPLDLSGPMHSGRGKQFVIEGDEYDTAFFDKVPKFLHYRPSHVILTSVEFDHADIYRDLDHVAQAFKSLMKIIPKNGALRAWMGSPLVQEIAKTCPGTVETYGLRGDSNESPYWMGLIESEEEFGVAFSIFREGKKFISAKTFLPGGANIRNWTAAIAEAVHLGVSPKDIEKAIPLFRGMKRRQEVLANIHNVLVIDDFAHHPTAVRETLLALRNRYKTRRIWAIFEPRTQTSCRRIFQRDYESAFESCDFAVIARPGRKLDLSPDQIFQSEELVDGLNAKGIKTYFGDSTRAILDLLMERIRPGDVIVFMSNGGFDSIHEKAIQCLKTHPNLMASKNS